MVRSPHVQRRTTSMNTGNYLVGTLLYVSPEQIDGESFLGRLLERQG